MPDVEARPFKTITLGNLIAAIPAFGLCIGLIIWATTQGNQNAEQGRSIAALEQNMFTRNDAANGRALRDAQITGIQSSITAVQNGITATLGILSNRMDRAFQRLDDMQQIVTRLETTITFMQRQARLTGREFQPDASSGPPTGTAR